MGSIIVTERVYLDGAGKATVNEEEAAWLWAVAGDEVTEEAAAEVGYSVSSSTGGAEPKAVKAPRGAKVVEGPEGDK